MDGNTVSLLKILSSTEMLGSSVVAGWEGLGRQVSSVAVVEVPLAMEWLKGGELVLTTGFHLKNEPQVFLDFIKGLVELGASGLAIPPRSFISAIPGEVINLANKLMFPIISLPSNATFWRVARSLMAELTVDSNQDSLEKDMLSIIEDGLGIPALLNYLAENTGGMALLQDNNLTTLMAAYDDVRLYGDFKQILAARREKILQATVEQGNTQEQVEFTWQIGSKDWLEIVLPVQNEDTNEQVILSIIMPFKTAPITSEKLRTACRLITVCFTKLKDTVENLKDRKRFAFRNVLIKENPERIGEFVKIAPSFDFGGRLIAVQLNVIERISPAFKRAIDLIETYSQARDPEALVTSIENKIIILLHTGKDDTGHLKFFIKDLAGYLEQLPEPCFLYSGVGRRASCLAEYKRTLDEALGALLIARLKGLHASPQFYEAMGLYQLIKDERAYTFYRQYARQFLGPILTLEQPQWSDLFSSLAAFFNAGCSFADAAKDLFIHENTLRYRLQKVEELLQIDLRDLEQRFLTFLAIKILMLEGQGD